jgi:ATP-dependent RNA helicase DeaD
LITRGNYLPAINNVLEDLSKRELIKKNGFVVVLSITTRKTRDLSSQSGERRESDDRDPERIITVALRDIS